MSVSPICKTRVMIISSHIPGGYENTVFKMHTFIIGKSTMYKLKDMNNSEFGQAGGTVSKAQDHSGQRK